jgi:hypothetical protein
MYSFENLSTFAGKPVREWDPEEGLGDDPAGTALRLALTYDEADEGITLGEKLAEVIDDPAAGRVEALVIGAWNTADSGLSSESLVEALAAARDRLTGLRSIFLGDIISEECEISWIVQSDLSPLLEAYPRLERLAVRGGQDLSFGTPRHQHLRELIVESGGLPPGVIHEIASGELPALEHLELWLGVPDYGGDATLEDLAPLLKGDRFPRLKYLGLKNSEIQDEIAAVVALAPVTERLDVLDLSMGTLGDAGGNALLASAAVKRLKRLDVGHHFMSPEVVARLKSALPGVDVKADDPQEPEEWGGEQHRYTAVSE